MGASILGYADDDVDQAVVRAISSGQTSALCAPEEVELAKKLVLLHPWAQQVRYARSGGEAITIAIRIAQAKTGRKKIGYLPTSYHGWHISNPITQEQFIVASKSVSDGDVAAYIVEPSRLQEPPEGYLEATRVQADIEGAVLIFDEISSGFRRNLGGVHLHYGVNPDIAVFSKAMSNGYPMAAVVGTADVMSAVKDTFISSTTWSERIGPVAALATINKLWASDVFEHTKYIGELVRKSVEWQAKRAGINITVSGPPQMLHFTFDSPEAQTLYTQLMLERGFLAGRDFYPSYAHTIEDCEDFASATRNVIWQLNDLSKLKGPVVETGIRR